MKEIQKVGSDNLVECNHRICNDCPLNRHGYIRYAAKAERLILCDRMVRLMQAYQTAGGIRVKKEPSRLMAKQNCPYWLEHLLGDE